MRLGLVEGAELFRSSVENNQLVMKKKKNWFKPGVNELESPGVTSNLTREKRLVPPWRVRLIGVDLEDSELFSFDWISSDDISHVVDLRNWRLKKRRKITHTHISSVSFLIDH